MTQAVRRKHHYIYKITRVDGSGKYYIGMHSTDDLEDGYFGSGSLLSRSIKKHGKDNHVKEILEHLPTREALKLREKEIVCFELLSDRLCMNLKLGGEGGWDHLNSDSDVQRAKGIKGNVKMKLLRATDTAWVTKNSEQISIGVKDTYKAGRIVSGAFSEKLHEMCERAKSSKAKTKRKVTMRLNCHQQGSNNSQFGSCWVTNGAAIKIKKRAA